MIAIERILVPTDFGDAAERALEFAVDLAVKFQASITLLHVIPSGVASAYADEQSWPLDEMTGAAQAELDALARSVEPRPVQLETLVAFGSTWRQILETARARDAGLIVMGTHGRRGLARVVLGSVSEKIVRASPVPVLTVSDEAGRAARLDVFDGIDRAA